ncbi:MAG: NADH-quinone oxidoreductase subunit N [Planctomycetota bacterium]
MTDNAMIEKLASLWPEMTLLVGAVACLCTGLWPVRAVRRATPFVAGGFLTAALVMTPALGVPETHPLGFGPLVGFLKAGALAISLILLLILARAPLRLAQVQRAEAAEPFEPGDAMTGEFFAFFLLSVCGVLLSVGATDLVWLFLALELTSLPTYVMVAVGRDRMRAQESAVKYFFLGAMSAAVFLYGFALVYGATGFTDYASIRQWIIGLDGAAPPPLFIAGLAIAALGLCFKIAAVPMHFYAADVYQGASVPVTSMLAFVPKAAGFAAMIQIMALAGWEYGPNGNQLPPALATLLGVIAVLTMTVGNVLGLLQKSVKRTLAYSSVAHSGYILVGVLAGPGSGDDYLSNGLAAVAFYLLAYGLGTIASFSVIGCLRNPNGDEAEDLDDLAGLRARHPFLAGTLLVACLSLLGFPFTIGLVGKLWLVSAGFHAGFAVVIVIMVINSAISAAYYVRIGSTCFFGDDRGTTEARYAPVRVVGAVFAAAASVALGLQPGWVTERAARAGRVAQLQTQVEPEVQESTPAPAQADPALPATPEAAPPAVSVNAADPTAPAPQGG